MRISNKKAIENVKKFNIENRYRDCGIINNSIDIVLDLAEKYINSKKKINRRIKELKQTSDTAKRHEHRHTLIEAEIVINELKKLLKNWGKVNDFKE